MHVALCDDNTADRKQSERLLQKESLNRIPVSGPLYVDSFGSAQSLLHNPMQYDVFFLDICHSSENAVQIAQKLIGLGVKATFVFCCSDMDYRCMDLSFMPQTQFFFLEKPIHRADLTDAIDYVLQCLAKKEHTIELRTQKDTLYVVEADIMYAKEKGHNLLVTLSSGNEVLIPSTAANFFDQIQHYPCFLCPTAKTLVNARYIKKATFHKLVMEDGQSFRTVSSIMRYAKNMMQEYRA